MQDHLPLDSYLSRFIDGEIGKKELEGLIFAHVLGNYRDFSLAEWEEDECVDFLCWLYPRISRAVDNYHYEGASFTAYIASIVRLSSKEYLFREREHWLVEKTYWKAAWEDLAVHSREPDYTADIIHTERPPFKSINNPRQALILLLKSYNFVNDEYIERAAPAIGISKETLSALVEDLRKIRMNQDCAIRNLRERIYGQYYRCKTFERRMKAVHVNSARHSLLEKRLDRAEQRLKNMKKALRALKTGASNRQVATILGLSKGAVDSSLHTVKDNLEKKKKDRKNKKNEPET
jgi:hypothetical protein